MPESTAQPESSPSLPQNFENALKDYLSTEKWTDEHALMLAMLLEEVKDMSPEDRERCADMARDRAYEASGDDKFQFYELSLKIRNLPENTPQQTYTPRVPQRSETSYIQPPAERAPEAREVLMPPRFIVEDAFEKFRPAFDGEETRKIDRNSRRVGNGAQVVARSPDHRRVPDEYPFVLELAMDGSKNMYDTVYHIGMREQDGFLHLCHKWRTYTVLLDNRAQTDVSRHHRGGRVVTGSASQTVQLGTLRLQLRPAQ